MDDVTGFVVSRLPRVPRLNTTQLAANGSFFGEISQAEESLRKLRLEFESCKSRFTAGPLDSDFYFSHEESVRIETELITAAMAIIVRIKNAIPALGEAQSLEQSLAWGTIQLVHKFSEAAANIVISECKELVKEIDSSVPKEEIDSRPEIVLDDYWEQENEELKTESAFSSQIEKHRNVQNIRQTMLEVKAVEDVFMQNLECEGYQILRIFDMNLVSETNLTEANKFITRAKRNLGDSTKLTVVLLVIAIAGLWWIDQTRGG